MYDGRACEVVETQIREPAAAPGPMAFNRVNDGGDEDGDDYVESELGALGHTTGYDGGGSCTEHRLEEQCAFSRYV